MTYTPSHAIEDNPAPMVTSPESLLRLLPDLTGLEHEELHVITLDNKNRRIDADMLYKGTVSSAHVRIGEIFREAVRRNASRIAIVHNHPTGDPTPSPADIKTTLRLLEAGELLDIPLLDHVITGSRGHVSIREREPSIKWAA